MDWVVALLTTTCFVNCTLLRVVLGACTISRTTLLISRLNNLLNPNIFPSQFEWSKPDNSVVFKFWEPFPEKMRVHHPNTIKAARFCPPCFTHIKQGFFSDTQRKFDGGAGFQIVGFSVWPTHCYLNFRKVSEMCATTERPVHPTTMNAGSGVELPVSILNCICCHGNSGWQCESYIFQ